MSFTRVALRSGFHFVKRSCHTELTDPETRKIRNLKRLIAYSLFGSTLVAALVVKSRKRQQLQQLLDESRLIGKFGCLPIFDFRGYVLAEPVLKCIRAISDFELRPDDIVLVSFPKTGTTWLQEIIWLLEHDLDYETAAEKSIDERFPYLEFPHPGITTLNKMTGRRFIKTHVAPSLLRLNKEHMPKVVSITRDPRDVLVSYFYFARMNNLIGFNGSWDEFFESFLQDKIPYGPLRKFFEELSDLASDPQCKDHILILSYEDLQNDFAAQIEKLCTFLGRNQLSADQMAKLKSHCSFREMSVNPAVNYGHWKEFGLQKPSEAMFMRKGVVGDWKNHFSQKQEQEFEAKMRTE